MEKLNREQIVIVTINMSLFMRIYMKQFVLKIVSINIYLLL